ncbi:MAG: crotonobetainyl-CoA:carnitine CoA-transferase CaiB-like acyl-CoA transferase [Alphaproteobacteria bacterium]|jgi:crotonobetainyl-CoA:carnitine CoA-transferase CaiB-like acyl-CoA transferase
MEAVGNIRVIELASILAGPWAGQLLADLGADVIKVERPGLGDETRRWGPPFVAAADGGQLEAAYFHACNRGKRSVEIDFTTEDGQAALSALIKDADVLIENFRAGALARYGFDYERLAALNPRLIHCSITGFGQDGPSAARPGYDLVIQGLAGLMDITGAPDGEPQKVGVAFADIFTGLYSVIAIQAALRTREQTGRGAHIDMALMDSMVGVLANQALNYMVTGVSPHRMGNAHPNLVPYQAFQVRDGHVVIAVGTDSQFTKLCNVLGLGELACNPAFATNEARVANRDDLIPKLEQALAPQVTVQVIADLEVAGIPVGPINSIADAFADPQAVHRAMRISIADVAAAGGAVPGLRTPIRIDGVSPVADRPSPRLGQHNEEILGPLGAGKGN